MTSRRRDRTRTSVHTPLFGIARRPIPSEPQAALFASFPSAKIQDCRNDVNQIRRVGAAYDVAEHEIDRPQGRLQSVPIPAARKVEVAGIRRARRSSAGNRGLRVGPFSAGAARLRDQRERGPVWRPALVRTPPASDDRAKRKPVASPG